MLPWASRDFARHCTTSCDNFWGLDSCRAGCPKDEKEGLKKNLVKMVKNVRERRGADVFLFACGMALCDGPGKRMSCPWLVFFDEGLHHALSRPSLTVYIIAGIDLGIMRHHATSCDIVRQLSGVDSRRQGTNDFLRGMTSIPCKTNCSASSEKTVEWTKGSSSKDRSEPSSLTLLL